MSRYPDFARAARALWSHGRASREELLAYQSRALHRLVAHAYQRVPYYRELFDTNGVRPSEIRTAADLQRIPVTTRRTLQLRPLQSLVAEGYRPERLMQSLTSGSSGQPLDIREGWLEHHLQHLFRWRSARDQGRRWGDRLVSLGRAAPSAPDRRKWVGYLLERCGMPRVRMVDGLQEPDRILAELRALRPDILAGYAGVVARVAGEVRDADRREIRPHLIICGGEVLTPPMRERIRSAWGAPVVQVYGSHECDLIGWECRRTGDLHASEDNNVVEVLAGDEPVGSDESGRIVLTSLHSYAMPFIRYDLGDVVTRGDASCGCGAPFATLREVQGRVVEYLELADGRLLHPFQLIRSFKHDGLGWLGEFQIAQRDVNTIDLLIVPYAAPPPDALERVRASLRQAAGSAIQVNVRMVREIPRVPGGKRARGKAVYGAVGSEFRTGPDATGPSEAGRRSA